MPSFIAHLSPAKREELFSDLNYMHMEELVDFCNKHCLPCFIHQELPDGRLKKTGDKDRKGIVIARIKRYLETGEDQKPTIFSKSVVSTAPLPNPLRKEQPVFYNQYKNRNPKILALLKSLTGNKFEYGAISQEVTRECWRKGKTPTYAEFAKLWQDACKAHIEPNPEWAFLADRNRGTAEKNWKKQRIKNANRGIAVLNTIKKSTGNADTDGEMKSAAADKKTSKATIFFTKKKKSHLTTPTSRRKRKA